MMYLKQFPDICREMGCDVEEKAKTITLRITDINYSIDINKKLFLEDLELILDSYSEVREAIAIGHDGGVNGRVREKVQQSRYS